MVAIWAAPLDKSRRALQRALRNDRRQQRRHGRTLERRGRSEHAGGDENLQHRQCAGVGAPGEKYRGQRLGELAKLHDALALVTVRGMAGGENQ